MAFQKRREPPFDVLPNCVERGRNWRLALRYGRTAMRLQHFTLVAQGRLEALAPEFECRPGPAFMGMKARAATAQEAVDLAHALGRNIGFKVTGRVDVYKSGPMEPPGEKPRGYGVMLTPSDES